MTRRFSDAQVEDNILFGNATARASFEVGTRPARRDPAKDQAQEKTGILIGREGRGSTETGEDLARALRRYVSAHRLFQDEMLQITPIIGGCWLVVDENWSEPVRTGAACRAAAVVR
jgi:hypothetical protein